LDVRLAVRGGLRKIRYEKVTVFSLKKAYEGDYVKMRLGDEEYLPGKSETALETFFLEIENLFSWFTSYTIEPCPT
jgi:hypothetical protein